MLNANEVREYLICDGFHRSYITWTWYDELLDFSIVSRTKHVVDSTKEDRLEEDKLFLIVRARITTSWKAVIYICIETNILQLCLSIY